MRCMYLFCASAAPDVIKKESLGFKINEKHNHPAEMNNVENLFEWKKNASAADMEADNFEHRQGYSVKSMHQLMTFLRFITGCKL